MEDRRKQIIEAGLALLREEGLSGLTQPRIVARTGLRQSHLTYYYPTRAALLTAVARTAIEAQGEGIRATLAGIRTAKDAAETIAAGTARHENARVLVALSQASEQEPAVRKLFNELTDGAVAEVIVLFERLGIKPTTANAVMLHALFVGLSVTHLATGRGDQQARAKAALDVVIDALRSENSSQAASSRASKGRNVKRKG